MSNTHPVPLSPGEILRRTAVPFLLFAIVLTALLVLSWLLLLPALTQVEMGGRERSVAELRSYRSDLRASILELEGRRDEFVRPEGDSVYEVLRERKRTQPDIFAQKDALQRLSVSLVPKQRDVVALEALRYDASNDSIELTGDVRNVGPRSMTILAQFTEALRRLPFIESVQTPRFVREDDPVLGPHSPFTITFFL